MKARATCWLLLAVSSEQQSETLDHQRRSLTEIAKSRGWRVTRDVQGVASGKEGSRRTTRALLTDLRALDPERRPQWVLAIRLDRLGRGSSIESQIALRDLRELGVGFWTRDSGQVKTDSAMDELIVAAQAAVARHENEVRIDKAKGVYARKRAAGLVIGNRRPYGLRLKDGKDVPDGKRAAVIREAFRLRAAGMGYLRIAKRLAAIAPPYRENKKGEIKTVRWSQSRLAYLFRTRAYIGTLVDEATFAKANRVSETLPAQERFHDSRRRWPWPLTGAVRCFCGLALSGRRSGPARSPVRYYSCRSHQDHGGKMYVVRADELEREFVALLGRLKASPTLLERYRTRAAAPVAARTLERNLRDLRAKLAKIDKDHAKILDLYLAGDVRREDVQGKLDALKTDRDDTQAAIVSGQEQIALARSAAQKDRDVAALVGRAARIFTRAKEEEQRAIARAVAVELGGLRVGKDGHLAAGPP